MKTAHLSPVPRCAARLLAAAGVLLAAGMLRAAAPVSGLPALWAERLRSVVAIEYVSESEVERRSTLAMGTVIDRAGTIIVPGTAIDPRTPPAQLKDFKVYLPGDPDGAPAEYLGPDAFTGWHFLRAGAATAAKLVPVTTFAVPGAPEPQLADAVWGIGLRGKDEDFTPYLMQSAVSLVQSLPHRTAIAQREVSAPGLPVFNAAGAFVGLAVPSFGQSYLQFARGNRGSPVVLVNVEESAAFWLAGEVLPALGRIPRSVSGRPLAWLGAYGLEPMDREVARFLNLTTQSGVVVSEVLEGSPAERAGLRNRDIILAIEGQPLPPLKPDRVVVTYFEREVERRIPGQVLRFSVLRGKERLELAATLAEQPKVVREADRRHFDRLGVTAREFVYGDAIERQVRVGEASGAVVHHVKPSSPVATAGLRVEDWIREIDGAEVKTFTAAAERLAAIEQDSARADFVLLVSRGGETAVLRVKLK